MELAQRHSAKAAGARALGCLALFYHALRHARVCPLASGVRPAPKETTRRMAGREEGSFFCVSSDSDEPA